MKEAMKVFENSVRIANDLFKREGDCDALKMRTNEIHGMKIIFGALGIEVQFDLYGDGWLLPGSDAPVLVQWSIL